MEWGRGGGRLVWRALQPGGGCTEARQETKDPGVCVCVCVCVVLETNPKVLCIQGN